MPIITQIKIF